MAFSLKGFNEGGWKDNRILSCCDSVTIRQTLEGYLLTSPPPVAAWIVATDASCLVWS